MCVGEGSAVSGRRLEGEAASAAARTAALARMKGRSAARAPRRACVRQRGNTSIAGSQADDPRAGDRDFGDLRARSDVGGFGLDGRGGRIALRLQEVSEGR